MEWVHGQREHWNCAESISALGYIDGSCVSLPDHPTMPLSDGWKLKSFLASKPCPQSLTTLYTLNSQAS